MKIKNIWNESRGDANWFVEAISINGQRKQTGKPFRTRKDFSGADAREVQFRCMDFVDFSCFQAANLENATFISCELFNASFQWANIKGATFRYCDLRNADFKGCDLRDVKFIYCNLQGADFRNADFDNCSSIHCSNLSGFRIEGAKNICIETVPEGLKYRGAKFFTTITPDGYSVAGAEKKYWG